MEPLEIRRGDIDLAAGTLRVLNEKKRGRPRDTITIPNAVREHFEWFLATWPGDEPFARYSKYTVTRYCKMWLRLAGLPEDLHLHNLRHTSISLAANHPHANLRAVQQFVGHSTITMTERYTHGRSQGTVDFGRSFTIQDDKP
jgi:integrase